MKVDDLIGAELDYWAAKAEYPELILEVKDKALMRLDISGDMHYFKWFPSYEWDDIGLIIQREGISIKITPKCWEAMLLKTKRGPVCSALGPTPQIAACRCFVKSRFGGEVSYQCC